MKLTTSDLGTLADCALEAACQAAQLIASSRPQQVDHKKTGSSLASQVVTEVDRGSEQLILEMLEPTRQRFDLGLLTEERTDDGSRHRADYFWCIDPLDGTLAFIEGRPGSAVSIALVASDATPCLGVVVDTSDGTAMHGIAGVGAFVNGEPWVYAAGRSSSELSVFADPSLVANGAQALTDVLEAVAGDLGLESVSLETGAGAVLNACRALADPPGCYLKLPTPSGGSSIWDFAATACLFQARGAIATDMRGRPLDLNRVDTTRMNHRGVLYATDEILAKRLRTRLGH